MKKLYTDEKGCSPVVRVPFAPQSILPYLYLLLPDNAMPSLLDYVVPNNICNKITIKLKTHQHITLYPVTAALF